MPRRSARWSGRALAAYLVGTEIPCVGSSILPLPTFLECTECGLLATGDIAYGSAAGASAPPRRARHGVQVTFRSALRLIALGCVVLFAGAIYFHSQPALVTSVLLAVAVLILHLYSAARTDPRTRLRTDTEPYLEPGETVQAVFRAVGGPGPYLALILLAFGVAFTLVLGDSSVTAGIFALLTLTTTQWTVVATDRALLLLASSARFQGVRVTRLPRNIRLGPVSGWFAMISLNGRWMFVHRRFHAQIELADNAIAHAEIGVRSDPELARREQRRSVSFRFRGHGKQRDQ